jgi:hypothetical protein
MQDNIRKGCCRKWVGYPSTSNSFLLGFSDCDLIYNVSFDMCYTVNKNVRKMPRI